MPKLLVKSDEYKLNINLEELGFNKECFNSFDINSIDKEMFFNFVFCSPVDPSDASHYGHKFSDIPSLNKRTYDNFFKEVVDAMQVKSLNLFNVYESEPNNDGVIKQRFDLREKIINEDSTFLYLYTGASRCEISLFLSIRNAFAHGNIFIYNGYYYLYSVSTRNAKTVDEFQRKIKFLLRISNINLLKKVWDVLLKYIKM